MRKRGLTSATAQHLQRLARGPHVATPVPEPDEPPVFNRRADWQFQEAEGTGIGEAEKQLSDKELIMTVVEGEGGSIEDVSEEVMEEAAGAIPSVEEGPTQNGRDGDPMLTGLEAEPWDAEWKVK